MSSSPHTENEEMEDLSQTFSQSYNTLNGPKSSILCINQWDLRSFTIDYTKQNVSMLLQQIADKQNLPSETLRII